MTLWNLKSKIHTLDDLEKLAREEAKNLKRSMASLPGFDEKEFNRLMNSILVLSEAHGWGQALEALVQARVLTREQMEDQLRKRLGMIRKAWSDLHEAR